MLKKFGLITLGATIQGLAMGVFLFPHAIPSGGAGGLAVLINYWFFIPMGIALWLVNFSLLVAAVKGLGSLSALGTMYAITITSLVVNLVSFDIHIPYSNPWSDLITGALLLGLGVGVLMRQDVSNGGIGVLALILAKRKEKKPGRFLFWMNGFIFVVIAIVINWDILLQAIICQWLSSRVVDLVYSVQIPIKVQPFNLIHRKVK